MNSKLKRVIIEVAVCAVLFLVIGIILAISIERKNQVCILKKQVIEQSIIIDSLLQRRMNVFDINMQVTDRTKTYVYGRYNKGTISIPQQKDYKLTIDSVSTFWIK